MIAYDDGIVRCYVGDVLEMLSGIEADTIDCVVTSPPYWGLRDYDVEGQFGLEPTLAEYLSNMVAVFTEVWRVLKPTGTLWLNMGDCYASSINGTSHARDGLAEWSKENARGGGHRDGETVGRPRVSDRSTLRGNGHIGGGPKLHDDRAFRDKPFSTVGNGLKAKDLVGQPWRLAFALQEAGWWLRSDIIWHKPNPMPESVTDRPTKAHEYVFLLTKSSRYHYDADAIREPNLTSVAWLPWRERDYDQSMLPEPHRQNGAKGRPSSVAGYSEGGRNARDVWTIATQPYPDAHFATFPEELPRICIEAGCPPQGLVLDPFAGSGTTLAVPKRLDRRAIGIELNPAYLTLISKRVAAEGAQMRIPL